MRSEYVALNLICATFYALAVKSERIMSNNEVKIQLIESGWFDIYCKYRRCLYLSQFNIEEFNKLKEEDKIYLSANFSTFTYQQMHCLEQLFESKRKKVQRLRKKIKDMLRFDCVFLTLTFSDAFLNSTSAQTRRTYVARFLKSQEGIIRYVANIDFGQNDLYTKREHYHALVQSSCVNLPMYFDKAEELRITTRSAFIIPQFHKDKSTQEDCTSA